MLSSYLKCETFDIPLTKAGVCWWPRNGYITGCSMACLRLRPRLSCTQDFCGDVGKHDFGPTHSFLWFSGFYSDKFSYDLIFSQHLSRVRRLRARNTVRCYRLSCPTSDWAVDNTTTTAAHLASIDQCQLTGQRYHATIPFFARHPTLHNSCGTTQAYSDLHSTHQRQNFISTNLLQSTSSDITLYPITRG